MAGMLRITGARSMGDFWVRLTLSDGTEVERNVRDLLRGPVFESIVSDRDKFARLRVRRGTLEWPGDIDLDAAVLLWNGPRPHDAAARPKERLVLEHPSAI